MATFETTRPAPFGAITFFRIISALDNVLSKFVTWNNTRATQASLSRLSDHELADIGLSRGEISSIRVR
jgi:uncharacterized protein YjiS (DUF1127 family)